MEDLVAPRLLIHDQEPSIRLLVADDDPLERALLASSARETLGQVAVFEAEDGAEAIQLGLQQRPEIALLDVSLPRFGGIEAAVTLRELQPRMRLALQTGDPHSHRKRAEEQHLPLFGKLELELTLAWLHAQAERFIRRKRSLVCGGCGYGVLRATPPDRCPMCQTESAWVEARPLSLAG